MTKLKICLIGLIIACVTIGTVVSLHVMLPPGHGLYKDKDFQDQSEGQLYHNKYGSLYKWYLVGMDENNSQRWDAVHQKWWTKDKHKGKFRDLDGGSTGSRSLKSVCGEAYRQPKIGDSGSKIKKYGTTGTINEDEFLEDDIWLLCSVGGEKIKTISEAKEESYYKGADTYGHKYKDRLVSAYNNKDSFWSRGFNWTKKDDGSRPDSAFAKILTKDEDQRSNRVSRFGLINPNERDRVNGNMRRECRRAYFERESDDGKYPKEHVLRYCTLDGYGDVNG